MHTLNGKMEKDVFYVTIEDRSFGNILKCTVNEHIWSLAIKNYSFDGEGDLESIEIGIEEKDVVDYYRISLSKKTRSFFVCAPNENVGFIISLQKYSVPSIEPLYKSFTFKIQFFGENIKIGVHSLPLQMKIAKEKPLFICENICMEKIADDDPRLKLDLQ